MTPSQSSRSRRRRRAFATVAAVVLIGLAGMVFVALTALVGHDLRRTARAGAEAQLRQLLTAGEAVAVASLDAPAGAEEVTVPKSLAAEGAKVSITRDEADGDERSVTVDVAFRGLRASQKLTYERREGRWVLVHAALSPTAGIVGR